MRGRDRNDEERGMSGRRGFLDRDRDDEETRRGRERYEGSEYSSEWGRGRQDYDEGFRSEGSRFSGGGYGQGGYRGSGGYGAGEEFGQRYGQGRFGPGGYGQGGYGQDYYGQGGYGQGGYGLGGYGQGGQGGYYGLGGTQGSRGGRTYEDREWGRGFGESSQYRGSLGSRGSWDQYEGEGTGMGRGMGRGGEPWGSYNDRNRQWYGSGNRSMQGEMSDTEDMGWGRQGRYGDSQSGMRQSHSGKGPKGWQRSDERIREEVNEALARHPGIDASEIEVRVQDGEVTLTGTVTERKAKRQAEDIAEDVFGVREVQNQVRVKSGDSGRHGEREVARTTEREGRVETQQEPTRRSGQGTSTSTNR